MVDREGRIKNDVILGSKQAGPNGENPESKISSSKSEESSFSKESFGWNASTMHLLSLYPGASGGVLPGSSPQGGLPSSKAREGNSAPASIGKQPSQSVRGEGWPTLEKQESVVKINTRNMNEQGSKQEKRNGTQRDNTKQGFLGKLPGASEGEREQKKLEKKKIGAERQQRREFQS
ncbi:hypothetical protein R1flu_002649 [Riccia fluitans]|uniref:Uncharacterized protein n=1 Tax=Riccia fluitans TaxID=41844 RepID=A0ABD1YAI9_9MARC